jgi:hypothetical protein
MSRIGPQIKGYYIANGGAGYQSHDGGLSTSLEPGDRVGVNFSGASKVGYAIKFAGGKVLVRLNNKSQIWVKRNQVWYEPTRERAVKRREAIAASWPADEREKRAQYRSPDFEVQLVTVVYDYQ